MKIKKSYWGNFIKVDSQKDFKIIVASEAYSGLNRVEECRRRKAGWFLKWSHA